MPSSAAKIRKQALSLPAEARLDLAYDLLASTPAAPTATERSDEEWLAEIRRRGQAARAGEPGLAWEEVRERIASRLRSRGR